jgi:tetratricopeptide (TPR) repeat protein
MRQNVRYIVVVLLFSFFVHEGFSQDARQEKFDQGIKNYSDGKFNDALALWLDIYNTGYRSANLDYNIGNAYFKLDDIPDAILFYERAYLLNPADENIRYNLEIARTLTVDRFQEIPQLFFKKWYDFVSLFLNSNIWAIISLVCFIFCLVFFSLFIYSSKYRLKVAGFWIGMGLFIISCTSVALSLHNKSLVYNNSGAIITSPQASGKSSPDASGTDLFVLHEGTKVTISDEIGEWYEITLSDGNKGWVHSNSLNRI